MSSSADHALWSDNSVGCILSKHTHIHSNSIHIQQLQRRLVMNLTKKVIFNENKYSMIMYSVIDERQINTWSVEVMQV